MPRTRTVPKYQHHRPSGQAKVRLTGRDHYLGKFNSPESKEAYARLIAEHLQRGKDEAALPTRDGFPDILIVELLVRYLEHAQSYYVKDGVDTGELAKLKYSIRPLRLLYGTTTARNFGPKALKAVRQHMITVQGLSRKLINARVNAIRRVFKWAVSEELVPADVLHALKSVDGLRRGRSDARETEPVRPVQDEVVERTLVFLSPIVADMVRVQRLTGMRPGSVVQMRPCDIDRSGVVWHYRPLSHKTQYREHRLVIPIGPRAQAILLPYLTRPPAAFLFSPREAEAWRQQQKALQPSARKTKRYPCEARRVEREKHERRGRRRAKPPGERYTTTTYYRAVQYGIVAARKAGIDVPHWCNNQLRHTRATEVRRDFGVEGAQVVLGHRHAEVIQVYAERDMKLADDVVRRTG